MHEASLYESNAFITLTYDTMPRFGSLDKRAFPLFMKRLRKALPEGQRVRYFACGEYGTESGRPHYHALLFGTDFPDKVSWTTRGGVQVFRSKALESLWTEGLSEIGSVTFESAAYVARYVVKKRTGDTGDHYVACEADTGEVGNRVPEFCLMSRRPGIGAGWLSKFAGDVYPEGSVLVRGKLCKSPRYYDTKYACANPLGYEELAWLRDCARRREDESPERLLVSEAVARSRLSTFSRRSL